jgi:hypothetical protein
MINDDVLSDADLSQRFWAKIDKNGPLWNGTPCWIWTAAKASIVNKSAVEGKVYYGIVRVKGSNYGAHRVSYILCKDDFDINLEVDHLCRNTLCVNPSHLEQVPHRTNVIRGQAGQYMKTREMPECCPKGHKFTPENTRYKPKGWRVCRECGRQDVIARRKISSERIS